ncbi:unnamed protein product, partial [Rotaria magnacalcarata]
KFQNKVRSKLTNTILNKEPILGQTESSITIGNQCSIDRIEENRKNFYHASNKVLHPSISSKELSFILNEPSDDSIAEVSDGEETQMKTCKKLASVAAGARIEEVFEETLSQKHHFCLNETELSKMNQYRQEELKKKSDQKNEYVELNIGFISIVEKKVEKWTHIHNT